MAKSVKPQQGKASGVIEGYRAVEEVRRIRDQLAQEMQGMTPEQKLAYWEREAEQSRQERTQQRQPQD